MLGKLLKHEWQSTWKLPTLVSAFVVLMTLAGCLSFKMPMWQKITSNSMSGFGVFDFLAVAILITYFISIIVAAFAIMIYFAIRFYKNLYTDEGYLMHTLPVTPKQLMISKWLISSLWSLLSSLLVLVSIYLLMYVFLRTMLGDEWMVFTEMARQAMPQILTAFKEFGGVSLTGFVILLLILTIVGSFSGMAIIYACISIGQLFHKHKVAASIITYLVISSIMQVVSSIAVMPVTFKLVNEMNEMPLNIDPIHAMVAPMAIMTPIYYIGIFCSIASAVVFYFVSEYIMKRKLNLD